MLSHDNVGRQSFSMYIYINIFTSPHIVQQLVYEVVYMTSFIHLFKIWKHANNKMIFSKHLMKLDGQIWNISSILKLDFLVNKKRRQVYHFIPGILAAWLIGLIYL